MIVDLGIYIFSLLIDTVSFFLPAFSVWPQGLLDGLTYFANSLAVFNFILPIDTFFQALDYFVGFESAYFTVKILLKFIGFFRKSSALTI